MFTSIKVLSGAPKTFALRHLAPGQLFVDPEEYHDVRSTSVSQLLDLDEDSHGGDRMGVGVEERLVCQISSGRVFVMPADHRVVPYEAQIEVREAHQ